jgi:GNAT superfamily N-acetyltransferase
LKIIAANTQALLQEFYRLPGIIHANNPGFRAGDTDTEKLLIEGPTVFYTHAKVSPFLIADGDTSIARFALIHDSNLPDYVQLAFFESKKVTYHPLEIIKPLAAQMFPDATRLLIGLNGHLNYGAGILQDNFEKPPVFGMQWHPDYYRKYFDDAAKHIIKSFSFSTNVNIPLLNQLSERLVHDDISVRSFNRKQFNHDIALYTQLNNLCFKNHPYWTNRRAEEDIELFEPFRFLMRNSNLLFAEIDGKPVGFLLWFPDFNEMIGAGRELKASGWFGRDVLRFRFFNPVKTFRLAEIAVLPEYRNMRVELALIGKMISEVKRSGYTKGVGGFIFEENRDSINLAMRYVERFTGRKAKTDSEFAVYECLLS